MKKYVLFLSLIVVLLACEKDLNSISQDTNPTVESRQGVRRHFQKITACEAANLTFFVHSNFEGTNYEEAIPNAMEIFNQTNTSLHFSEAESQEDAHLVFLFDEGECGSGLSNFPDDDDHTDFESGGTIGRTITFFDGEPCDCSPAERDLCFYTGTVMHEVMHNLGFVHNTDQFMPDNIWIEGTSQNDYDPGSIINLSYPDFCNKPCSFNQFDLIALETVYSLPFDAPDHLCSGERTIICLTEELEGVWQSSNNISIGRIGESCIEVTALEGSGEGTISFCGATKTIELHNGQPCQAPSVPPVGWDYLCFDTEQVCYDFGSFNCIESINIESSSPKLLPIINGTEVCLTVITTKHEEVTLTVEVEGYCGEGEPQTWNIVLNDDFYCPEEDPGSGNPN